MNKDSELEKLRSRITELEEKVEHLRFSRRVLMSLIERIEKEKTGNACRLEQERKRLQSCNSRFAKWLVTKNRQIVMLEEELKRNRQVKPEDGLQI